MNARKFVSFFTFVLLGVGLVAVPAPAQAAGIVYSYAASTGATYVKLYDGVVQSDLTAQSSVTGGAKSSSVSNSTAAVKVFNLADIGAVQTKTDAVVSTVLGNTTTTLKSFARAAHVSLLGGLITADAVETNVTTTGRADGSHSFTANSSLAGIKIAGINLPLNIPKNYSVTIPGVASVTLNYALHGKVDGLTATLGWAVGVTLLQPMGGQPAGVTLLVNPVNHYLSEVDPASGAGLAGVAYGTRVNANVGSDVTVVSDPTARVATPAGSSNGRTLSNSTLSARVTGVLTTGVITSTTTSTKDAFGNASVTNTNKLAGLNLLGGLVKADAIEVITSIKRDEGKYTGSMQMKLVRLTVAGQTIPLDVSPNTIINIAGVGEIAINRQETNTAGGAYQNRIIGLRITLDTAQAGLPVGAVIESGVAYAAISPPAAG
ncbi:MULTISPECIES: choice-of-anchor P family protein [unclassified Nocardioides]|uniref:choice-of-anchor P family protein n=1 Tax=unclassified Nocardioides TaxID=2615069 RepID=UPI0006F6412E|nr:MULTISPECIES: choice-of-anchor P family protein [unclassified Nocardioides]KRA38436.1 hypothetical protein ASD81_07340 [Nocardioides sp. Root614]KRA92395.1 hypothetical protein ASD84_07605 [Nocardioides sp. Root682]